MKHLFFVSSSMLEHHFINWNQCKAGQGRAHASKFAVKNCGYLDVGGMSLLLCCIPTNQVYCSCFILPDMLVLNNAELMTQSSHMNGWVSCTCISLQPCLHMEISTLPACLFWTAMLRSICSDLFLLASLDPAYKHVQALPTSVLGLSLPSNFSFVFDTVF